MLILSNAHWLMTGYWIPSKVKTVAIHGPQSFCSLWYPQQLSSCPKSSMVARSDIDYLTLWRPIEKLVQV